MKLPDTDEQYDWNEIYSYKAEKEFQGEYERRLSYNKKTYREIEDNKWKTLQACVDWAIQMGNHAAFVRFYLHKAYDQYSFFEFVLEDMLSMYHIKKKEYAAWKIIKNTYWIKKDIADRDYQDMHRDISPLKQADDAVLVDSSDMGIDEVVEAIKTVINKAK